MQDTQAYGRWFIRTLIAILLVALAIYVVAHLVHRDAPAAVGDGECGRVVPEGCPSYWARFARVERSGEVAFFDFGEIDWYVGHERARPVIERIGRRGDEIVGLRRRVRDFAPALASVVDPRDAHAFEAAFAAGDYAGAYDVLQRIRTTFGGTFARTFAGIRFDAAEDALIDLQDAVRRQYADLNELAPPLASFFFWTSPTGSILEVLFWSLFGVLTNLLVASAMHLTDETFDPKHTWIAWTKLAYGPVLSTVVVLAMINGFFQVETWAIRVWTLPLLGFIFGYASRRTATLFERIIDRFLGGAMEGAAKGPVGALKARRAVVEDLMSVYRAPSLGELERTAKTLAADLTAAAVTGRRR